MITIARRWVLLGENPDVVDKDRHVKLWDDVLAEAVENRIPSMAELDAMPPS